MNKVKKVNGILWDDGVSMPTSVVLEEVANGLKRWSGDVNGHAPVGSVKREKKKRRISKFREELD